MADVNSNININIDASEALATLKTLQKQISAFHTQMAKSGAAANAVTANMQQNLVNAVNATGKWQASFRTIQTTTESFTHSLEKNQLSMREYFRYATASTKTFGRIFQSEFETVNKVARERVKDLQTQYIKLGRDASGAMKAIAIRPLALDMKDYGTQVQISAQRQQLLNQLLKQGSTNLLNFGKNTQWAGRQLMVGFTVPLLYFGTAAGRTFMKLEEQAIRFKRVYGEMFTTTKETDKALKDVQLLAKEFTKYGVAVEKTMEMAATAASQGKMGADLLAQVKEATRLSVLGGVDQEQALQTTISLTNAFGIAADQLGKKINFLNAVENQTVVSIEDLTTAVPKAGPVVQQLGGNVEDLAFFLTAMKEGGINASEGANALKSGLASLINPTAKASTMLAGMGINIQGIVEANKGNVKGVVVDFAKALDTLDPLNRARAIEQLFGKFQFARLSTLFQNVIKDGSQAQRVLQLTNATTEELAILSEREMKRIEDSPMYKFKKAVEDLKVTIAPVGAEFLKAVTPIVQFIGKILDKFNGLSDGAKKFAAIMTIVVAGIGPVLLMTFGLVANAIANIIKLFTSIKGVFNRAGSSTKILGEQTDYLTQQQMEAAAIASSLEQIHARLQQRFTSEAGAVTALTLAYRQAVAAQSAFMGPMATKGLKTQGLNRGTTNVRYYAKGTDTVPAMLTPGEAVIPAEPAQNPTNKPYIKHMVAGGVIGEFASGTVEVGGKSFNVPNATQSTIAAMQRKIDASMGQIDDIIINALNNLSNETKIKIKQFQNEVRALAKEQGVNAGPAFAKKYETREKSYNAAKAGERRTVKQQLVAERGPNAAAAEMARANASAKAIKKTLEEYGATTSQIANATQIDRSHMIRVDNEQKKILAAWHSNIWTAQTGAENNAILNSLNISARNRKAYMAALEQEGVDQATIAKIMENVKNGVALTDEQLSIQGRALRRIAADAKRNGILTQNVSKNFIMYADAVGQGALARERVLARQPAELKALTVRNKLAMEQIANELPNAAAITLQTQSPSKKMRKIGRDTGAGMVLGAQEYIDDAKAAGAKIGSAIVNSTAQSGRRVATRPQGPAPIGLVAPAGATVLPIVPKPEKTTPQPQGRVQTFLTNREAKRQARIDAGKNPGMGAGGAMMAASGVMMAASMVPGQVGETAQKLMMPMMGLTMIMPLLQSKMGALTVGVGALVAAVAYARMAFDKAQDNALKLGETLGSGASAMKQFSEFAGTVSASEIMSKRRQAGINPFQIQTGKTTFGESYVQSEKGKALTTGVGESIKNVGRAGASSQLANQLATGVISGALSASQARSIAANIGKELGDYGFGINVNAKLIDLIGINGENLLTDPLTVKVKMLEETRGNATSAVERARQAGGWRKTDVGKSVGYSVAGGLGGAAAGAIAGGALGGAAAGAAMGSVVPVIGTAIGAALGIGVGFFLAQKDRNKRIGEASGASVAMQKIALEQEQQMIDALDVEYEKKISAAEAAGNQAEKERLTTEYIRQRQGLLDENAKTVKSIQDSYAKSEGATKDALMTGVDKAITAKYKDTALADVAPLAKTAINDSGISKEQQYTLKMQLATGNIDPMQMIAIFDTFKDKKDIDKVVSIITKFGGTTANDAMTISSMFVGPDGKPVKSLQTKFIAQVEAAKTSEEAKKVMEFYAKIAQTGNVLDTSIIVDLVMKNPKLAQDLQKKFDFIEGLKGKITIPILTKVLNKKEMDVLNDDLTYFNSLKDEQKKIYLQTLVTTLSTVSPDDPALKNWLNAEGSQWKNSPPGTQLQEYAQWNAQRVTVTSSDSTTAPKNTSSGGGNKPEASPLDDIVKKLKEVQKNQIAVTVGWEASMKALRKLYADGKSLKGFSGITQDLLNIKKGTRASGPLIDFILGMDPKEYEKQKNKLFEFDNKKNIVGLKKDAKIIQAALFATISGDFQSKYKKQTRDIGYQATAFDKLTKAGISTKEAYDLVSDASLANMIAAEKDVAVINKMIAAYKGWSAASKQAAIEQATNNKLSDTQDIPKVIGNQQKAIAKLTAQGLDFGTAYSYVEDALVASSIAGETNIEVLKKHAAAAKDAAEATKQFTLQQQFAAKVKEWQDSLVTLQNQRTAITKLVAAGFSLSDAYSIVQDSAVAATIAQSQNNEEIKQTGELAKKTTEQLKLMSAAQSLVNQNQAAADKRQLYAFLQKNKDSLTNDQIKAILENPDLAQIVLNPSIDPAALQEALDNAATQSTFDFNIKKLTIQGMEEIFNEGFSKAMEAFDAKQKQIEIKFSADTSALTDPKTGVIPVAENAIALLQYQLDDWNASLKDIEEKEKTINDNYDTQVAALEQVQKINEKIARQEKGRLTIADALSRGDIAAAAVAIQEARQQAASDQLDTQRTMLDAAKENQLANVRNSLGLTRKQVEAEIKKINDEIFNIEEQQLEPAKEKLRLAERQRDIDIAALTVLGKTKPEWEAVKNGIDLARTSSVTYTDAMQAALDIVKDIVDYWTNKVPTEKTTIHNIITKYSTEGSAADCCSGVKKPECPDGYYLDASGKCVKYSSGYTPPETKTCPSGYILNDAGNCIPITTKTECPPGTIKVDDGKCLPVNTGNTDTPPKSGYSGNTTPTVPKGGTDTTTLPGRADNAFTPFYRAAKDEYDSYVADSLKPGATPSDFGANLARSDQKVINAISLIDAKNAYDEKVAASKKTGSTPSDFGADLARQDALVIKLADKVIASDNLTKSGYSAPKTTTAPKPVQSTIGGMTSSVVSNFLAEHGYGRATGGIIPKGYGSGGSILGTDIVPAMLTPGEFIVSRDAVDNFGIDNLRAINNGNSFDSSAVYNYSLNLTVNGSDMDENELATTVMNKLKQVENQKIRRQKMQ